jgi:hypothetical protein
MAAEPEPEPGASQGGPMNTPEPAVMQRKNERRRLTAQGKRTDDGTRCTFLVVHEVGEKWVFYPHGAAQLGVRLPQAEAHKVAQAILEGGAE